MLSSLFVEQFSLQDPTEGEIGFRVLMLALVECKIYHNNLEKFNLK